MAWISPFSSSNCLQTASELFSALMSLFRQWCSGSSFLQREAASVCGDFGSLLSALSWLAYRSDCRFFFTCASFTLIKPRSNQPILPTPNVFASELAGRSDASLSVMQTRCNSGSLSPAVADLELVGRGEHLLPHRLLLALLPLGASAAGLPPWRFGMSKAEVVSFKQLDPYKQFSNSDLETFNGTLIRIGVRCGGHRFPLADVGSNTSFRSWRICIFDVNRNDLH